MRRYGNMPKYLPRAYRPRLFTEHAKMVAAYATVACAATFIVIQVVTG
jgi:hypothetical protein